jgi:hypothetical protein
MTFESIFLLFLVIVLILLTILSSEVENYGWSFTFTPNKDYYKQDWILGDNSMSDRIAALAIKR